MEKVQKLAQILELIRCFAWGLANLPNESLGFGGC